MLIHYDWKEVDYFKDYSDVRNVVIVITKMVMFLLFMVSY